MPLARTAGPASSAPPKRPAARAGALAALSLAMVLSALGTSSASVALPALAAEFGATFAQVQAVVLAYLLAVTALVVAMGRLGDVVGRRRLLLGGLGLFSLASLLCALAPTLAVLVAARALQGLGGAVMMALTMALVGDIAPPGQAGRTLGLLGTMSALGTALGPSIGGAVLAALGWRAIFALNVPLGVLALGLALRGLPPDRIMTRAKHPAFDWPGAFWLAAALITYALALASGPVLPRLAWAAATLGCGAVFVTIERGTSSPLVPFALWGGGRRVTGLFASALVATVMMTTLVVGPFYLSFGLGLDAITVGLVLSAGPLAAAAVGVPAGKAVDRFGGRRTTIAGLVGVAGGATLLVLLPASSGVLGYAGPLMLITMSYILFQTANTSMVLQGLPSDRRGVVSGLLSLSRNVGLITGASLMGSVFAAATGTTRLADAQPAAVALGMHVTYGAALALTLLAVVITARGSSPRSTQAEPWRRLQPVPLRLPPGREL